MKLLRYALAIVALAVTTLDSHGQEPVALVDIKTIDPTIVVALRYASPNNITAAISISSKSGMPIGRPLCSSSFGRRSTTTITSLIPEPEPDRCTAGESRSM